MKCYAKKKVMLSLFVLSINILLSVNVDKCLAETNVKPNIEPGKVFNRDDLPKGVHMFGIDGRTVWGKHVLVNWMIMEPGTEIPAESNPGTGFTVVWKGSVEHSIGGEFVTMKEKDCIYLSRGTKRAVNAIHNTAELIEVYWPENSLFDGNSVNFPGTDLTYTQLAGMYGYAPMSRPWEPDGERHKVLPQSVKPSVKTNTVFSYYELQFCQPEKGTNTRIIHGELGQVCFIKMNPDETIPVTKTIGDEFHIVLSGSIEKTIADSTALMEEGDLLYLASGMSHDGKAGPKGCEVMVVVSPGRPEYTAALRERYRKYHSIIPPDTRPQLMYDGRFDEPGLHCTEGPSWMGGTLYFSNYYYFWKMYGTKNEGGVNALKPDGSRTVINKEMQTNGTTPLPNGNLAVCDLINNSVVEMTTSGKVIKTIADSYEGKTFAGPPNDIITDKKGGLYFTVNREKALFYLDAAGKLTRVTNPDDFTFPNGCLVSRNGTKFFLNNTGNSTVWVFDVNSNGTLSNKRLFAKNLFSKSADGIAMDRAENLYIATNIGIQVWDRDGEYMGHIYFPKPPFNCVFGGNDLSMIYATCRNQIYAIRTKNIGFQYPIQ